jgi:hypothetical protein
MQLVQRMSGETVRAVTHIVEEARPQQGASGSEVRLYLVTYQLNNGYDEAAHVVIKNASPLEQQVVQLLTDQQQAIPAAYIPNCVPIDQCCCIWKMPVVARLTIPSATRIARLPESR